jgi:hypothetical protein
MSVPIKSALLHRKPVPIRTSRDSCGVQDSYKGNALYKVSHFVSWYNILIRAVFPTDWYGSNCLGCSQEVYSSSLGLLAGKRESYIGFA